MTREELLELVNKKTDTKKFVALSKKTIDEELDDALEEMGDDEAANDNVVERLAKRLKRMDGNVHVNVAAEAKKNKDAEAERKRKEEEDRKKRDGKDIKDDDVYSKDIAELRKELAALKEATAARAKAEAKNATLKAVKDGLKAKFKTAGIEMNDTLAGIVMGKLEVPDEEADVAALMKTAEAKYTTLKKDLGIADTKPKNGNGGGGGSERIDEHEWDDIKD